MRALRPSSVVSIKVYSTTPRNCTHSNHSNNSQPRRAPSHLSRAFSTTTSRHELYGPNATSGSSIPPVTPERTQGNAGSNASVLKAAAEFKRMTGRATETYVAYGVAEKLYHECARQADYAIPHASDEDVEMPKTADGEDLGVGEGWWHTGISPSPPNLCNTADLHVSTTDLGLNPTFSTWSQVTMLHMYLLSVRFRAFPPSDSPVWQQHLLDHFFYDAETRMVVHHNMHAHGTRNKYLKDLFIQWRGLLAAYDEGIYRGDAVLASAVWRNVFKASADVDVRDLACIVSYMRRALKGLDRADDEAIASGNLTFADPGQEKAVVEAKSKMMDSPFRTEAVPAAAKAESRA